MSIMPVKIDRRRLFSVLASAAVAPALAGRPPTIFYVSPYLVEPMTFEQCEVMMREAIEAGMFDRVRRG